MAEQDNKYWVGICPPQTSEQYVATFKTRLEEKIGWYSSVNAKAHISFFEFMDDGYKLIAIEDYLSKSCKTICPFDVTLSHVSRFRKTCCMLLNKQSEKTVAMIMQQLHRGMPFYNGKLFDKPHVSIGRELNEEQLTIALHLFSDANIHHRFHCDSLAIRRLNSTVRQYEIYKQFKLTGYPVLTLF